MKIAKFTTMLIALVTTLSVFGQKHLVGAKGGVNLTNAIHVSPLLAETSCGVMYEYIFVKEYCAIEIGFMYNQIGSSFPLIIPADASDVYPDKASGWFNGFSIPLQVKSYFGKKLYGNVFIGIEPTRLFRKTCVFYQGGEVIEKTTLTIKRTDDFRFYLSGFAGFSIGYKIQNKYHPFTTISYQRGFFPLRKYDERMHGMNISVGLKYVINY